jgi:hypothetical protein
MVVQFAPLSNDSNAPCQGITLYNLGRPSMPQTVKDVNLAFFVALGMMQFCALVGCWLWQEKPRFRKVRPFVVCFTLIAGFELYQISAWLSYAVTLPCGLVLTLYIISVTWFGAIGLLRALVLALEGNYAKQAQKEGIKQDDQVSEAVTSSLASTYQNLLSWRHIRLLVHVISGWIRVNHLHITEIVAIKNSYPLIIALMSIPAFVIIVLVLALSPPYQTCYGCDVFLELIIGAAICMTLYVGMALAMIYQAYSVIGLDEQGVVVELTAVGGVLAPLAFIVWTLMLTDPGGFQYQNQFNWSLLFIVPSVPWLSVGYIYQFFIQWRQDRNSQHLTIPTMDSLFGSDAALKADFYDFAARRFVTESLNFISDVKTYKSLYYEKAESWRQSKFRNLIETYIVSGSRMEVNISYDMKVQIIKTSDQLKRGKGGIDLFDSFDEASKEVERMVHNGAWTEYVIAHSKKQHAPLAVHSL